LRHEALSQKLIDYVASDEQGPLSPNSGKQITRFVDKIGLPEPCGQNEVVLEAHFVRDILSFLMETGTSLSFLTGQLEALALYTEFYHRVQSGQERSGSSLFCWQFLPTAPSANSLLRGW
jgi:hypothetical protein